MREDRFRIWAVPVIMGMALLASACSSGSKDAAKGNADTKATATASFYETDVAPIFQSHCATCHLTGQEAGKMSLVPAQAIATLVGVPSVGAPKLTRVVAGDPDSSYILMKLEGTHIEHGGAGARMPFGAPTLSADKIARIRKWISEGAKP